jgi:hypothetical protein
VQTSNNTQLVKRDDEAFFVKCEKEEEIESEEFCNEDIDSYICRDKKEIERKRVKWERDNSEWLEDQVNKERIRLQREQIQQKKERIYKKKSDNKSKSILSQNELVNKILNSNRTSKKIDTSALEKLFKETQQCADRSVHSRSVMPPIK